MFLVFATSFVADRVRTAYCVYLSHLAESTLPMCCINVEGRDDLDAAVGLEEEVPPGPDWRRLTHISLFVLTGSELHKNVYVFTQLCTVRL